MILANPFLALLMIPGGAFIMLLVYRLMLNFGKDFHRPSYNIGMISAVGILCLGGGIISLMLWLMF